MLPNIFISYSTSLVGERIADASDAEITHRPGRFWQRLLHGRRQAAQVAVLLRPHQAADVGWRITTNPSGICTQLTIIAYKIVFV